MLLLENLRGCALPGLANGLGSADEILGKWLDQQSSWALARKMIGTEQGAYLAYALVDGLAVDSMCSMRLGLVEYCYNAYGLRPH